MCGILFSSIDPGTSFDLIKYRGPDNTSIQRVNNYYMCHHRLNIITINNDNDIGNQPIIKDDIFLVCNGEIYNYKELDENVSSDCEVIIGLYKRDYLNKLDGDYAFILYDSLQEIIVFGRDPVGLKPLFYYIEKDNVIISSELKVIEDILKNNSLTGIIKKVDVNTIYYLNVDNNDNNDNDNDNDNSKLISKQILPIFPDYNSDYQYYSEKILDLLTASVKKRLYHSNKPVAVLCSGGIDSSIITTLVHKYSKEPISAFTLEYNNGQYNCAYADILFKDLGIQGTKVIFDNSATKYIPEIIRILETHDPNTIRAAIPMYMLAKYIKENTNYKVILSGEGADELFMGYNYFHICNATNDQLYTESIRLVKNLHSFDILRAERCFSAHGLELRVPFLDADFVSFVLRIPSMYRINGKVGKDLLRSSVKNLFNTLGVSDNILTRAKEKLSDGVGYSWVPDIINYCVKQTSTDSLTTENSLTTEKRLACEKSYYKKIYDNMYTTNEIIPREMPDWATEKQACSIIQTSTPEMESILENFEMINLYETPI